MRGCALGCNAAGEGGDVSFKGRPAKGFWLCREPISPHRDFKWPQKPGRWLSNQAKLQGTLSLYLESNSIQRFPRLILGVSQLANKGLQIHKKLCRRIPF